MVRRLLINFASMRFVLQDRVHVACVALTKVASSTQQATGQCRARGRCWPQLEIHPAWGDGLKLGCKPYSVPAFFVLTLFANSGYTGTSKKRWYDEREVIPPQDKRAMASAQIDLSIWG